MITSQQIGRECLGPLIYRFCYRLWLHQLAWTDRQPMVLFLSRGGIRLRSFYEGFLKAAGIESPLPVRDFYVSRMAALMANMAERPRQVAGEIAKEFRCWYIRDAMGALLPWGAFEPWWNSLAPEIQQEYLTRVIDRDWLMAQAKDAPEPLRAFFRSQAELFRRHLDEIRDGRQDMLLVDTGWSGSILNAIQMAAPDLHFMGHFFGRYAYGEAGKPWFWQLVGVEVEGDRFRWSRPQTCIFQHRHLIEGMCEVDWPSVEGYRLDEATGKVVSLAGPIPPERIASGDGEPFAAGVEEFIAECGLGLRAYDIHRSAAEAAVRLRRLVCFPKACEAHQLTVPTRSADFGKNLDVDVLLKCEGKCSIKERIMRVDRSLWREGQIALEFPVLAPLIHLADLIAPGLVDRIGRRLAR